jgi:hypothetical protein
MYLQNKLECFPWQAFPAKGVLRGASDMCSTQLSLLRNIWLGREVLSGTNTLAYSAEALVTKKKVL